MADDLHYVAGDFYRIDDRTGFKVRASRTRKEWTGRIVDVDRWERRHPQDFVRGVRDDQSVVDPRPRQADQFIAQGSGSMIEVYYDLPIGGAAILVQSPSGPPFDPGDTNPDGTAEVSVYGGTIPPVTPESL